jgi:homoserine dehydrogenase
LKIALLGYGHVGQAFVRLVQRKRDEFPFEIAAIHTLRHGTAYGDRAEFGPPAASVEDFLDRARADVLVELTTLNPFDGQPAIRHIEAGLDRGLPVITANKGPVAFAWRALQDRALQRGLLFRHEAAVMDGTPVFTMVRNCLPGVKVLGFAGALNSTSKLIIDAMGRGLSFEDGVREAQQRGLAEADATYDYDGWDSACKAAALANVLMEAGVNPQLIERKGIARLTPEKIAELRAKGKKPVLVSRAKVTPQGVKLRVRAEVLDEGDFLAAATGSTNLLELETDLMGVIGIYAREPGVEQTAYGVFSDLVEVWRQARR